jgi:hypothetical protein
VEFFKSVLAGVAGSILFWFIDKQLLTLSLAYQIAGMVAVFIVCAGVFWLSRGAINNGVRLLSGNKFKKGLTTTIERTSVDANGGADILSANKVSGPAKIDIKDTSIKT